MFKTKLTEDLKRIFAVKKVTFDLPGDHIAGGDLKAGEQECIFVSIKECRNTIKDGLEVSKVTGMGTMFAQFYKMKFGFFSKRIKSSGYEDADFVKDFFFFDIEENKGRYQNIVERSFSFIYFYSSQHDPALGNLNELELTEV